MTELQVTISRLAALVDRLRPADEDDVAEAESKLQAEVQRLLLRPEEAQSLGDDFRTVLSLPYQTAFYAETGVRSALGFWLELSQRLSHQLLPLTPNLEQLRDLMRQVFRKADDHEWVTAVSDQAWLDLALVLKLQLAETNLLAMGNILEAARVVSYRLAGAGLDRELLRADASLEQYESPFLAQNAALVPILERARTGGVAPSPDEIRDIDVLLDQCTTALERVRRKAGESGISIRLTYLLARLRQLIARLRELLDLAVAEGRPIRCISMLKTLLAAEQHRFQVLSFMGENVSLLARNITDHASRHGEHYIAENQSAWWAMARSAAGGGVIIAIMAMLKIQLGMLHLPPLTEGILFGLNYGIGFVLIHLLGFTVATKQPAMTAAAIAATLEEAKPRELEKLGDLVQNVIRTQFIAVLGNVGLAVPVACVIAWLWQHRTQGVQEPFIPAAKLGHLLADLHPLYSGALFFAAVAGVGLFLSGLVSGFFDNQARYQQLAARISAAPGLAWLGKDRATRLGNALDTHYGAILGNLFFGMYLGLVGVLGALTGLPVDIRHVAFSSANVGTAMTLMPWQEIAGILPWAIAGVISIALVNLAVSFALALYVAMQSRRIGGIQAFRLAALLGQRFIHQPFSFFRPPAPPAPD